MVQHCENFINLENVITSTLDIVEFGWQLVKYMLPDFNWIFL